MCWNLQIKHIDWSSITMITINESEQDGTSLQKPTWPDHRLWCLQGKTQSYSELVSLFLNHIFSLSKSYSEWASDVYLIAGIVWYQFLHSLSPSFKDSTGLHLPAKKDQQLYGAVRKVDFLRLFFHFWIYKVTVKTALISKKNCYSMLINARDDDEIEHSQHFAQQWNWMSSRYQDL